MSVNQSFESILENKPSIQSQLGYIPTLSLLKTRRKDTRFRWAHRLTGTNSYQDTFNSYDRPYRRWIRYSSNNVEARLGLQKITFGPYKYCVHYLGLIPLILVIQLVKPMEALRLRYFPNDIVVMDLGNEF